MGLTLCKGSQCASAQVHRYSFGTCTQADEASRDSYYDHMATQFERKHRGRDASNHAASKLAQFPPFLAPPPCSYPRPNTSQIATKMCLIWRALNGLGPESGSSGQQKAAAHEPSDRQEDTSRLNGLTAGVYLAYIIV